MDEKIITSAIEEMVAFGGAYMTKLTLDGLFGKDYTNAIQEWSKKGRAERIENIKAIFDFYKRKAKIQNKEATYQAPARIAERILNEGSYCTNRIMQEYYAGVLLSTQGGFVDDEGIFYLSIIHRLSSIQLKAHYVIYQIIKQVYNGRSSTKGLIYGDHNSGLTYIRASSLMEALYGINQVDESDKSYVQFEQYEELTAHILQGLRKENLVNAFFIAPDKSETQHFFFRPSVEGLQLFLWGQGYGKLPIEEFLKEETICPSFEAIPLKDFFTYSRPTNDEFDGTLINQAANRKFNSWRSPDDLLTINPPSALQ